MHGSPYVMREVEVVPLAPAPQLPEGTLVHYRHLAAAWLAQLAPCVAPLYAC